MQNTAALPIAISVSQLAAQFADTHAVTSSPKFSWCAPATTALDVRTGTDSIVEAFALSTDELAKFHELNINPPSVSNQVIEIFRSKLAQN